MTAHFELSIMIGMRETSGSAAIRWRKRVIAFSPSISPSSMLTSRILAPPSTWSRATARASSKLPLLMRRANRLEPVMFVRSPITTKLVSGRMTSGSSPL